MTIGVISTDFLIAPANCEEDDLEILVTNLLQAKMISSNLPFLLLENDPIENLTERGFFPTEKLFNKNFSKFELCVYSARDITKVVNWLLANMPQMSKLIPERTSEWSKQEIIPEFKNITRERNLELNRLLEDLIIHKIAGNESSILLHFCQKNNIESITLSGILEEVYPEQPNILPLTVDQSIKINRRLKDYLTALNPEDLFRSAKCNSDYKLAFYVKALQSARSHGICLDAISLDSFEIGSIFIESLKMNQCLADQNFFGAMLNCVCDVLIAKDATNLNIFSTTKGGKSAREHSGYTAFREHITKSGPALRLMFWRDKNGRVILSNVGPKKELYIHSPEFEQ